MILQIQSNPLRLSYIKKEISGKPVVSMCNQDMDDEIDLRSKKPCDMILELFFVQSILTEVSFCRV